MFTEPTSTVRAKRLRERRSRGVAMIALVEVGEGGMDRKKALRGAGEQMVFRPRATGRMARSTALVSSSTRPPAFAGATAASNQIFPYNTGDAHT